MSAMTGGRTLMWGGPRQLARQINTRKKQYRPINNVGTVLCYISVMTFQPQSDPNMSKGTDWSMKYIFILLQGGLVFVRILNNTRTAVQIETNCSLFTTRYRVFETDRCSLAGFVIIIRVITFPARH